MYRVDSWIIHSDHLVKIADKSFLKDGNTGLPRNGVYQWFLNNALNSNYEVEYRKQTYKIEVFEKRITKQPFLIVKDRKLIESIIQDTGFGDMDKLKSREIPIEVFQKFDYPLIKFKMIGKKLHIEVIGSNYETNKQLEENLMCDNVSIMDFISGERELSEKRLKFLKNIDPVQSIKDRIIKSEEQILLGYFGECSVYEYERRALAEQDLMLYQSMVKHASIDNDGLGYDILSFDSEGRIKHIEVKTTFYDLVTPFYLSANEIKFAQNHVDSYYLYRLYDFDQEKREFKLTILHGDVINKLVLNPSNYMAFLKDNTGSVVTTESY